MWRTGVLSHNTGNHIYANGWLHHLHFWANVRCLRKVTSDDGWRTLQNTCAFVVFVVVCFVMSRFEWNRCSCAVHSTLGNACTYKVSGCVLGPKGKLSGVSRFQVLEAPDTNLLMWATKTCCCILIHYGAFCGILLQCILCHSVSFCVILVHSHAFLCTFMYSTAFCHILIYSITFATFLCILLQRILTHSNAVSWILLHYIAFSYILLHSARFCHLLVFCPISVDSFAFCWILLQCILMHSSVFCCEEGVRQSSTLQDTLSGSYRGAQE